MVVQLERHVIDGEHGVVYPVAEVAAALVHGDHHFLDRGNFTVVISNILHAAISFDFRV